MLDWAVGRPKLLASIQGAIVGAVMGIVFSFQDHNSLALLAGLPSGVSFGVVMYFVAGRDRNYPALSREECRNRRQSSQDGRSRRRLSSV